MKKLNFKVLSVLATTALIAGCASTRVFPQEDGTALMVASSASESAAYDAALDDAQKFCSERGRRFVMVSQSSTYNGMDKNAKAAIETVSVVLGKPTSASRHDDYRVELNFRCI